MATYYPPTEDITEFNTALFTNEPDAISQGQASLLYLSKVNSDTSTAPQTTFTNNVSFTVLPQSSAVPSNLPDLVNKSYTDTTFQTIANMVNYLTTAVASATYQTIAGMSAYLTTASASATYQTIAGMSAYLTIASASITYLTTASASATYQTIAGMSAYLTTASASATYQTIANMTNYVDRTGSLTETINGFKTFTNNVKINTATTPSLILEVSATEYSNIRQSGSELQFQNRSTLSASTRFSFSGVSQLTIGQGLVITQTDVELQTRLLKSVDTAGAHTLFDNMTGGSLTIGGTASTNSIRGDTSLPQNVVIGGTASIGGIITLTTSSYSFPLPSTQNLGYYYQETGASYNVSNVFNPETIFNTSITIPVGIWRVDFTIQTTCVAAGTISTAQSYVSTLSNQPISSAVPFLGAIIQTTIPKVFALNEVDLMISSFTYYQTTAGQVRITVARTYTGTYGIVGAMAFTRIA